LHPPPPLHSGACNFAMQCQLLRQFLLETAPDVQVVCRQGRRGAFEVRIDDQLVHSKLATLAFPQHQSVLSQVQRAQRGEQPEATLAAPITDCSLM
ncbi:hypothetical protein KR222_003584, partial [Zaprionus bogoriensis]